MQKFLKAVARWAAPTVLLAEVVLVWTDVLSIGQAVVTGLILEILLAGVVVTEVVLLRRTYRTARAEGKDGQAALEDALRAVLPLLAAKALSMEFSMFRALWLWMRRKPDVPTGHGSMRYGTDMKTMLVVLICLTPIEIGAVEFLVPWPVVRVILLILALYGMVWLLAFVAALKIRPHVVGGGKLTLRFVHFTEVSIPLDLIESVSVVRHSGYRKAVNISEDGVLAMPIGDTTTLCAVLREPWKSPVKSGKKAPQELREIRFHADDQKEALALLKSALASPN